jgi:hypothetical protein
MRSISRAVVALVAAAVPLTAIAAPAEAGRRHYQATLEPLNHSHGGGIVLITLNGHVAHVRMGWRGLTDAPHLQELRVGGRAKCPTLRSDVNHDGVVSATEGARGYGDFAAALTTDGDTGINAVADVTKAPKGRSTTYVRKLKLSTAEAAALRRGTAVVIVQGLATAPMPARARNETSDLSPSLKLATTSPALCGDFSPTPKGAVKAGAGSTAGAEDPGLLAGGGALLAAGAVLLSLRRRAGRGLTRSSSR